MLILRPLTLPPMAELPSPQRLAALREHYVTLAQSFDVDALGARAAELEQAMGAPGFWDDQENAAKVSAEHARVTRKLHARAVACPGAVEHDGFLR